MNTVLALDSTDAALEAGLETAGYSLNRQYYTPVDALGPHLNDAVGILVRSRVKITADLLQAAPNLKWIGRLGSGVENIDRVAAAAQGVTLYSAPEGNRTAVGEHCMGLLLSLIHRITWSNSEVRQGLWLRAENTGWELEGSTVGIIGFGHMGSAFAERLQGFGVNTLAYDRYKTNYSPNHVHEVDLETLLQHSDVISLHVPLTPETLGMVNADFIAKCGKRPFFLNTSRGQVIQSEALWHALQRDQLRGVAVDVLDLEKSSLEGLEDQPDWFSAFCNDSRVLITPHIAGWSTQSFPKMGEVLLRKILH
ncbi:MAG TPA: hypothetical protein DCE58_02725 [Cryomorphaceae bacterium]|nr:hypothetical protein [Cryomorphaceae bacterium]